MLVAAIVVVAVEMVGRPTPREDNYVCVHQRHIKDLSDASFIDKGLQLVDGSAGQNPCHRLEMIIPTMPPISLLNQSNLHNHDIMFVTGLIFTCNLLY